MRKKTTVNYPIKCPNCGSTTWKFAELVVHSNAHSSDDGPWLTLPFEGEYDDPYLAEQVSPPEREIIWVACQECGHLLWRKGMGKCPFDIAI